MAPSSKRPAAKAVAKEESGEKVDKQKLALYRATADKLTGSERKGAIQNMLSWLSSNAQRYADTPEGKEIAETLAVYKTIEDPEVRDDFIKQFYKARMDKSNDMKWHQAFQAKYSETETKRLVFEEGHQTRTVLLVLLRDYVISDLLWRRCTCLHTRTHIHVYIYIYMYTHQYNALFLPCTSFELSLSLIESGHRSLPTTA